MHFKLIVIMAEDRRTTDILRAAREAGLAEVMLHATLNAAPFYRTCGFVGETVCVYTSPRGIRLDCVPMRKEILPS